jgi:DNA polymerase-3 subunit delta
MRFNQLKPFELHLKGPLAPLHVILSEDEGFLEWSEEAVLKAFQGTVVRCERLTHDWLIPSLFNEKRLFIAPLDGGELALQLPLPDCHVLLYGKRLLSNTKVYKWADEKGVIFQLPQMKPYEKERILMEWLTEEARKEGKILSLEIAKKFVEMQEGNFSLLRREWEKLLTYVGEKKTLVFEDVQKVAIRTPKEEVFSFVDALLRGDGKATFSRLDDLLAIESSPIALLKLVRNGFQNLLQLHTLMAQGAPPEAIQKDLPYMQGRLLDQLLNSAKKRSLKGVQQTLIRIDQLETEYKNSVRGDPLFLDYFVASLLKN